MLPEDEEAPEVPVGLEVRWESSRRVWLSWEEVEDGSGVVVYRVYRDGVLIGQTGEAGYLDRGGVAGAVHEYRVEAEDYHGNRSGMGLGVEVRLPERGVEVVVDDVKGVNLGPGWWPATADVDAWGGGSRVLAKNASARWEGNLPARGLYEVWVWVSGRGANGTVATRDKAAEYEVEHAGGVSEVVVDQNARLGQWGFVGTWEFGRGGGKVTVKRQESGWHTVFDAVRFVMLPDDEEAPGIPVGMRAEWESSERVRLWWGGVTDASEAVVYRVYRDGEAIGETEESGYVDVGAEAGAVHAYAVEAVDFHGNTAGPGEGVGVRVPEAGVEVVVEESEADFFGAARSLTGDADAHGGESRYVAKNSAVRWEGELPVSGAYAVWAWVSGRRADGSVAARDVEAEYGVEHGGGTGRVVVDQNERVGDWQYLGTWRFGKGRAVVTLERQESGWNTVADAVRFGLLLEENGRGPSVPAGLSGRWLASDRVELKWGESADDLDGVVYEVRRDGEVIGQTVEGVYVDEGLDGGRGYRYAVEAVDYHGERSGVSGAVFVRTPEAGEVVVVDDERAEYVGSPWWGVSNGLDVYGANAHLLQKNSEARVRAELPARGVYEVWAWISGQRGDGSAWWLDNEAEYEVRHAGGVETVVVDQGKSRGGWVWLGSWEFGRGTAGSVTVRRQEYGGYTVVDALKWVMLPVDERAPARPGGLELGWESATRVRLRWEEVGDESEWVGYRIYRDGEQIGESLEAAYVDEEAAPGVVHAYAVEAVDYHGNSAGAGGAVEVRLPVTGAEVVVDDGQAENLGPGAWSWSNDSDAYGGNSRLTGRSSGVRWRAGAPVTGHYEVWVWASGRTAEGVEVVRDSAAEYEVEHAGGVSTVVLDQNTARGAWAFLGSWRMGRGMGAVTVRRQESGRHTVADAVRFRLLLEENGRGPTVPAGVRVRSLASDRAEVRWEASVDDLDGVIYEIRRDGEVAGETVGTVWIDEGLLPGARVSYTVRAHRLPRAEQSGERVGGGADAGAG